MVINRILMSGMIELLVIHINKFIKFIFNFICYVLVKCFIKSIYKKTSLHGNICDRFINKQGIFIQR